MIHSDVRSITGKNLRNILLMCDKIDIEELKPGVCSKINFKTIPPGEEWRVNLVKELIDVKHDASTIENLSAEELEKILELVCTTGPS